MSIADSVLRDLASAARDVSAHAYCPYSQYPVGAAVLTVDGEIFTGCNVENVSYGLGICAERNAIFQAVARGKTNLIAVLVYTPTPDTTTPCGACRQVINEFAPRADVFSVCDGPPVIKHNMADLLPVAFQLKENTKPD